MTIIASDGYIENLSSGSGTQYEAGQSSNQRDNGDRSLRNIDLRCFNADASTDADGKKLF